MRRLLLVPVLVLAATPLWAGDAAPIGVIKAPTFEQAKAQSLAWLKEAKADAAALKQFEEVWQPAAERTLLDRVAATFALADVDAKKLVESARDPKAPAPTTLPAVLKDAKRPLFFRANLGLFYAKQLGQRRVHEEAVEVLRNIRPEHVVDPASYYFFKASAEHKLQLKQEGLESIHRLLNSVPDAPERYVVIADLMKTEMEAWKDKDLGYVSRLMGGIERRLDLARGGPKTQDQQKEVVVLLDKIIEEMEKQC